MKGSWSSEEVKRLKEMRIDPVRNTPEKLLALVTHFKTPGASVFAVTEGGSELHVSTGLARKVRDLAQEGKLDWVAGEETSAEIQGGEVDGPAKGTAGLKLQLVDQLKEGTEVLKKIRSVVTVGVQWPVEDFEGWRGRTSKLLLDNNLVAEEAFWSRATTVAERVFSLDEYDVACQLGLDCLTGLIKEN